jgi:uncharacterized phage protein (TIGR01671 family)
MQERYLFKAKRKDDGEWVIGNRIDDGVTGQVFIHAVGNSVNESDKVGEEGCLQFVAFEVAPATICQCTGLKDKNGNLIWENDIVMTVYDGNEHIYQVVWDESELDFKATNGKENYESNFEYLPCCDEIEILGNCFDNPELLEEEE